ncbi:MAG: carboxypeptidase regulatory-like domain-containing protein, partial [Blastocatellia bacterium]
MSATYANIALRFLRLALVASLTILCGAAEAVAQTASGGLRGAVSDANGGAVAGATVMAKNIAAGAEVKTITNSEGLYALPRLLPGQYNIYAEASGFKKAEYTGAEVLVGKDTVVDLKLDPGAISEVVTVIGGAEALVEKDSVQISTTFQERKVQELPVNVPGRGIDRIALLAPGVTVGFGNVNGNGVTLSANGQRARSNNFTIDGVDNNDLSIGGPSFFVRNPGVVGEFQVITNNFSAEYGRNQGAIVNIVSKAGGNDYHGNVAWDHLDAANFNSLNNLEKAGGLKEPPPSLDNIFSYAVGGPVVKNKIHFFTTGWFQRNPAQNIFRSAEMTPTAEGLQTLKTAFPNNPAIQYLAEYGAFALPLGVLRARPDIAPSTITLGATTVPVVAVERTVSQPVRVDEYTARGDATWRENHRFWGRYFWQKAPNINGIAAPAPQPQIVNNGFIGDVPQLSKQLGGGWTWTASRSLVNEYRFNYSRLYLLFGGGSGGGKGQIPGPEDVDKAFANLVLGFTAANGRGLLQVGPATITPQGRDVKAYQFTDNLTWTLGSHQLKMGVDLRKLTNSATFLPGVNGQFVFATPQQLVSNTTNTTNIAFGPATINYDEFDQYYYFQDDWRIRPNLTLNFGVRYEYTGQPINLLNDITTERESDPAKAFWRQSLPLEERVFPRVPADKNNWAPRFGLVYSPRFDGGWLKRLFGEDKTTLRGGFGMAYDAAFYNLLLNISTAAPLVFSTSAPGFGVPDAAPVGGKVRDAVARSGLIRFNAFDPRLFNRTTANPNFAAPYSEQWSFGVQREFLNNQVIEARYVGTHGVGLFQTINANPFVGNLINGFSRNYFDPATNTAKTLNFPGFASLFPGVTPQSCADDPATPVNEGVCNGRLFRAGLTRERINGAQSLYHGLQMRYDGRFKRQWIYGLTYTWSHSLDNSSEVFNFAGGNTVAVSQNPLDLTRGERGNSGFDTRHAFTANFIWDLPFMREQKGFLGRALGGWQLNGIMRVNSGRRFTPAHNRADRNPYEDAGLMNAF